MKWNIKKLIGRIFNKSKKTGFYTYCDYEREIVSRVLDVNTVKYKESK